MRKSIFDILSFDTFMIYQVCVRNN